MMLQMLHDSKNWPLKRMIISNRMQPLMLLIPPGDYECFAEDFKEIHISSNIAWDNKHSAGDSLNDLCYFMAYSYASALNGELSYGALSWIKKRVNELTAADLELLSVKSVWLGFFDEGLPITKPQTITVSVTMETGRVLTASYKITGK
ncbi:MAG: hypothetical protein ACLVK4_11955 [Alistipes shahii]|uniref:hypothetical protein n=1 Tax=Alistipes shahii TaxID=328814 RepID=UPI00399C5CD0